MIDVLLLAAIPAAVLLYAGRKLKPLRLAGYFALSAVAAHTACCAVLFSCAPRFQFVQALSAASRAGLRGTGEIAASGSLGSFLAMALHTAHARIQAGSGFEREFPIQEGANSWKPLDAYEIAEASGGLMFFPARPVIQTGIGFLLGQLHAPPLMPVRIFSAQGEPMATVPELLDAVAKLSPEGVASLRFMRASPDNSADTLYYAPHLLEPTGDVRDIAQQQLGLTGLPVLGLDVVHEPGTQARMVHFSLPVEGPVSLARLLRESPKERYYRLGGMAEAVARPRMALLPRVLESALSTWAAGIGTLFIRPVASMPNLITFAQIWPYLPKPVYLLDDVYTASSLLYFLSSYFACLAIGQASSQAFPRRLRPPLTLLLSLFLEAGCFFVLRRF